jgi:hypothetical protein
VKEIGGDALTIPDAARGEELSFEKTLVRRRA